MDSLMASDTGLCDADGKPILFGDVVLLSPIHRVLFNTELGYVDTDRDNLVIRIPDLHTLYQDRDIRELKLGIELCEDTAKNLLVLRSFRHTKPARRHRRQNS